MDVDENTQNGNEKRKKNTLKSKIKDSDAINLDKKTNRNKRKKSVSNHADVQAKTPKLKIQRFYFIFIEICPRILFHLYLYFMIFFSCFFFFIK